MKKLVSVFLAVGLLLALAACTGSPASPEAEEIIIGGLAPLTGEVAKYGIQASNGAKLAVEEANANGGILGLQVKFILEDEKGDATEAVNAYNKLVEQDKIVALVGDVTTTPTIAVAQRAAEDNLPMITPTATGAAVTTFGENVFRSCFIDPYQGELLAHYAQEELEAETVAILFADSNDYSVGIADAFEETAKELGLNVVARESFPADTSDFNSLLTKIKAEDPDVILVPCYIEEVARIMAQARALDIDVPFLGGDGWDGVLAQVGESNANDLNGCFYVSQFSSENPSDALKKFMEDYNAAYGEEPTMFSVLGYEAMGMMLQAIETAGSADADAIIEAMKAINFQGLTGTISFPSGNDPARDAFIIEFVEGKEKVLGTYSFV